ncbi:MAG: hypothetical protein P1V81_10570 [Planctomycetota bacterium]|nr:hypothetical protein [Planctomycetota bacterium]
MLGLALLCLQGPVMPAMPSGLEATSPWELSHDGVQARVEETHVLQVIRNPCITRDGVELRASMAIFWLDRDALESRRIRVGTALKVDEPQDMLDRFSSDPTSRILREVYFEGPIEYSIDGNKIGSAGAFYLDLTTETGWIADAEFLIDRELKGRPVSWRARAEWLQRKSDGTLQSNQAVVTTCSFVDRHLYVQTDNLVVSRVVGEDGEDGSAYDIALSGNSLRAYGFAKLPLPPLSWSADQEGRPILPEIKIGSSARFGNFVETALSFDASGLGDVVHGALGTDLEDPAARKRVHSDGRFGVSLLGSRGVLLDLGMLVENPGHYTWDSAIGGLFDRERDRGLLRVEQDDRDDLRTWIRSRGRFHTGEGSWLDLALSTESDPGVQAEFYEDQFLNYEQRDNYLHWRHAEGGSYFSARVKTRLDSARSQTAELPAVRAAFDRRPIAELLGRSVLYSSDSTAGWYQRLEGDPAYQSPFAPPTPFADGLGSEDVLRADSTHRFELPFTLGAGLRFTPFVEGRATAWDRNLVDDDGPARFDLVGGGRLSTAFWKRFEGGTTVQLAPFLELRESVVHEDEGGAPLVIDQFDLPTGADELSAGLRGHVFGWREEDELDVEVKSRRSDIAGDDDWKELEVFAGLRTRLFDRPVGLSHDGRYDMNDGNSLLTRSTFGYRPTDDLGLELIHARALDETGEVHYEAATINALYTWTPKWEFEGRQTFSVLEDSDLAHEFLLRRYGHDLIFELGISRITGEGGTTFTLRLRPEALFRRPSVGTIEHR